jgi:hypothetical protein
VIISGNDVICIELQGTSEKFIAGGVVDYPVCVKTILGNDGLSEYQMKKSLEKFIVINKTFFDSGIMQNPIYLSDDLRRCAELKFLSDPEFL